MKKLIFIVFMVLAVSALYASEPEQSNPVAIKTNQIEGKVTDISTGEALVGVSLKLKGCDQKTYTDLNGNFRIKGLTPGTYDIDIDYVSYKNITLKEVSTSSSNLNLKVELESVTPTL